MNKIGLSNQKIPRREFMKLAAVAALVAGCVPLQSPTTTKKTVTPVTPTAQPPTNAPTVAGRRPEIIKFHPDAPSRVVQTHCTKAWNGEELDAKVLRRMLDASIKQLTGLESASQAWAALFSPKETIAIKVNTIRNSLFWTQPMLVMAVTDSLKEVGIPAEQIVVYDRAEDELTAAGYMINEDGPGVRCRATGTRYTSGWKVADRPVSLSEVLMNSDALINMPILKSHLLCGVTFAMKNHYGTFDQPQNFHENNAMMRAIAELNALPPIKKRQRLIVGDALLSTLKEAASWPYWRDSVKGDSIFMSFDPVACDAIGLQRWCQLKKEHGEDTQASEALAKNWLQLGADLGVGTNNAQRIDSVEIILD